MSKNKGGIEKSLLLLQFQVSGILVLHTGSLPQLTGGNVKVPNHFDDNNYIKEFLGQVGQFGKYARFLPRRLIPI